MNQQTKSFFSTFFGVCLIKTHIIMIFPDQSPTQYVETMLYFSNMKKSGDVFHSPLSKNHMVCPRLTVAGAVCTANVVSPRPPHWTLFQIFISWCFEAWPCLKRLKRTPTTCILSWLNGVRFTVWTSQEKMGENWKLSQLGHRKNQPQGLISTYLNISQPWKCGFCWKIV